MDKLLGRLSGLLAAGVRELMEPAPDPREAFASPRERQAAMLAQLRRAIGESEGAARQIAARCDERRARLAGLEGEALAALQLGRAELARAALAERLRVADSIREGERQLAALAEQRQRLALTEQRLEGSLAASADRLRAAGAARAAADARSRAHSLAATVAELQGILRQADEQAAAAIDLADALDSVDALAEPGRQSPLAAAERAELIELQMDLLRARRALGG